MLKDRVKLTSTGFKVLAEKGRENCQAYYGEFALKDSPDKEPALKEVQYWDAVNAYEAKIEPRHFVLVVEKDGERVVDSCRFYFSNTPSKPKLRIAVSSVRGYGKNAQKITIEWVECRAESINSRYIYLADEENEKYYFLRDVIQPLEPDGKRLKDEYIFRVPDGHKASEYRVETDPLVREKYSII